MTTADVLFSLLGVIAAGSAILAVSTRQLVHAALWLTASMAALSGCYLVLGAELVALVQLLVYVGAIVVLVLFAVMLTRSPMGKSHDHTVGVTRQILGFVTAAATTALLLAAFWAAFGMRTAKLEAAGTVDLATNLFSRFTWPFEVLSLVLLVALVGALAMVTPTNGARGATGKRPAGSSRAGTTSGLGGGTKPHADTEDTETVADDTTSAPRSESAQESSEGDKMQDAVASKGSAEAAQAPARKSTTTQASDETLGEGR